MDLPVCYKDKGLTNSNYCLFTDLISLVLDGLRTVITVYDAKNTLWIKYMTTGYVGLLFWLYHSTQVLQIHVLVLTVKLKRSYNFL